MMVEMRVRGLWYILSFEGHSVAVVFCRRWTRSFDLVIKLNTPVGFDGFRGRSSNLFLSKSPMKVPIVVR